MKGKIVNVNELVFGRKYWVEFFGKDWFYMENSVRTYKIATEKDDTSYTDEPIMINEDGKYFDLSETNIGESFEITIYEWNETITQYGRIKNMTIEEMGLFIKDIQDDNIKCNRQENCDDCIDKCKMDCINFSREEWLKSEYKED